MCEELGDSGSELLFVWGLLDGMSFLSLSFIRFMAGFRHRSFCKDNNNLRRD
jgi:hypothetical protein